MKPLQILGGFLAGLVLAMVLTLLCSGSYIEWRNGGFSFRLNLLEGGGEHDGWWTLGLLVAVLGTACLSTAFVANGPSGFFAFLRQFHRTPADAWIGGVCGGLGAATPVPAWVWRLGFTLALFLYGTGLGAYFLLWIFVPQRPAEAPPLSNP